MTVINCNQTRAILEKIMLERIAIPRWELMSQHACDMEIQLYEAQRTIAHLRSCPLPAEPKHSNSPEYAQWKKDVQHYESHLASNPPGETE